MLTNKNYCPLTCDFPGTNDWGNFASPCETAERLHSLERMIKDGTLVFLPCKVDDTVYYVNKYSYPPRIETYIVAGVEIRRNESIRCLICSTTDPMNSSFLADGIGNYIFTSKEAAEQALQEVRDDK